MTDAPDPRYALTLAPLPGWPTPPVVRLRGALKVLLRGFGLRCLEVSQLPGMTETPNNTPGTPGRGCQRPAIAIPASSLDGGSS